MSSEKTEEDVKKRFGFVTKLKIFLYTSFFITLFVMFYFVQDSIKKERKIVETPVKISIEDGKFGEKYLVYYIDHDSLETQIKMEEKKGYEKNSKRKRSFNIKPPKDIEGRFMRSLGKVYFAGIEGKYIKLVQRFKKSTDSQGNQLANPAKPDDNSMDNAIENIFDLKDMKIIIEDNSFPSLLEIWQFLEKKKNHNE